jgi:Cu(I)/Ag(I) efflux system membrane fusion protein
MLTVATGVAFLAATGAVAGDRVVPGEQKRVTRDTLERVQGSCGMCKTRVEKTALGVKGVKSASWEMKSKRLFLELDATVTSRDTVARALAKAGHDAGTARATDAAYAALPGCCKYRK